MHIGQIRTIPMCKRGCSKSLEILMTLSSIIRWIHMNKLLRTVATILAAGFLFAGCTSPRTAEADAGVRSVAVVSLLSEAGPVRRVGFTVFGNTQDSVDQGGKLKQVVNDTVTQRLRGSRPQWTVKPANLDLPAAGKRKASENTAALADLARRLDVDQVFVLEDTNSENFPGQGVGVTFRSMGNKAGPMMVHAYVALVVVDRNGKVLVARGATRNNPTMVQESELGLHADLATLNDPKVRDNISQAVQRRLKGAIEEAMERAGY
jgi:hypothetical protein